MKNVYIFCCLLYATRTEEADIHVEGFAGGSLSFRCSHNFAWKNHKYFCKDPCQSSGDTLVTVESGGVAGGDRITLVDFGSGVFSVTFNPLVLSDTGRYWCSVDRPGFDTFTAVILTVKEAMDTTTVTLDVSSTWTYQHISNSTQISEMDTRTNSVTASNHTDGGKNSISAGPVLFSTAGAVVVLTLLVLAMNFRKCRKNQEQQQACSKSTDHLSKRKADCEHGETEGEVQAVKKKPERSSPPRHPREHQPTSASTAADWSAPLHIYENVRCTADAERSRNTRDERDGSSRIYIRPLPPIITEKAGDVSLRQHPNKENCSSKETANDSSESRPVSLWFGLPGTG